MSINFSASGAAGKLGYTNIKTSLQSRKRSSARPDWVFFPALILPAPAKLNSGNCRSK